MTKKFWVIFVFFVSCSSVYSMEWMFGKYANTRHDSAGAVLPNGEYTFDDDDLQTAEDGSAYKNGETQEDREMRIFEQGDQDEVAAYLAYKSLEGKPFYLRLPEFLLLWLSGTKYPH